MHTRIVRLIKAFQYSMQGLKAAWKYEKAIQDECIFLLPAMFVGIYLGNTGVEKALLAGSCLLVVIVELLNSAVEAAINRIGTEWNELSGRAKDLGSAAVFVALCNLIAVWGCILLDY